jgi:hypothetical protein
MPSYMPRPSTSEGSAGTAFPNTGVSPAAPRAPTPEAGHGLRNNSSNFPLFAEILRASPRVRSLPLIVGPLIFVKD